MDTDIKVFCEKYKKKLKNDKLIEETKLAFHEDFRDRISFEVSLHIDCPVVMFSLTGHTGRGLFTLDSEDLEYLYNRYSKKIKAEMERNMSEIKDDYKDALNS